MKKVAIIGGGASGLFTAICLKKASKDLDVVVLERLERVGKKILSTGNGKCNFSNIHVSPDKYSDPYFVSLFLDELTPTKLCDMLSELGLMYRVDSEGRIYPYSETANSFLDVLRNTIKSMQITEKCNFEVNKIHYKDNKFIIENTRKQTVEADYVVLATGGKASPVLGSNGSGYTLLKPWKVKITDTIPGLVGIKVEKDEITGLSGIRYKAKVSLVDKKAKQKVYEESGEVQFKDDGVSGIVIMQMASMIARSNIVKSHSNYYLELDLLPDLTDDELINKLMMRKKTYKGFETMDYFSGIFPKVLGLLLLKKAKIDLSKHVEDITNKEIVKLSSIIKSFVLTYKETYGFDRAQVTIGGIDLGEIHKGNLSIKKIPHMYACGEVMDIDGECGGYNMHWAFTSGYIVAKNIIKECEING